MPKPSPVTINGVPYTSLSAAAKHFNIPRSTLASRLKASPDGSIAVSNADTAVVIGEYTFSNLTEAAKYIGLSIPTLQYRLKSGWSPEKIMSKQSFQRRDKAVTVQGISFLTTSAMIEHFDICEKSYRNLLKKGHSPERAVSLLLNGKHQRKLAA